MASSSTINEGPDPGVSEGEPGGPHNVYRLSRLFLTCAPYLTRELLTHRVRNTEGCMTVQDFLNNGDVRNKLAILKNNRKILSQTQFDVLYPSQDEGTDIKTWDLPLVVTVLVNCFELQVVETNALETLKQYRRYLFGRSKGFSISDSEFDSKWTEMSTFFTDTATILLGEEPTGTLVKVIADLKEEVLSADHEKEFLTACHKWLEDASVDGRPAKSTNKFKETLKVLRSHGKTLERMHLSAATTEMQVLIGKFKSTNILVLKGPKGSGKTHLAHSMMSEMMKGDEVDQIMLRTPSEILKHLGGKRKLVVLADNALGQFVPNHAEIQAWNDNLELLLTQIEEGKLMLIFTIRSNVLESCREEAIYHFYKIGNTVDVTTFLDKRNALVVHAAINEVRLTEEKIRALCTIDFKGVGFQLLCSKFVRGNFDDIVKSFRNPVLAMKEDIQNMQVDHQVLFITLFMTLLSENKLKMAAMREENSVLFTKVKHFWSSLSLDTAGIETAANSLVGLYLTDAGDGYSFMNGTALESVFLVGIETVQSLLMECCPFGYIGKFTKHIESHRMSFSYLINRLLVEKNLDAVAKLQVWTNDAFVKAAVYKLGVPFFYKMDSSGKCLIVYFSGYGHLLALKHLESNNNILKSISQAEVYDQLHKSLVNASANTQYDVVEYLVTIKHVAVSNEMLFRALEGKDDPKVLSYLLGHGGNIKYAHANGENLFHIACERGKFHILEYIYIVCEELAEATDKRGWTSLHFAAKGGSIPCYEFVYSYRKYSADLETKQGSQVIHIAAEGTSDFLAYLASKGVNIKAKTTSGQTVLHLAALLRNVDTVWYLCEIYKDLILEKDERGWNALHYASQGGSVDCIRYLIDKGLDPRSPTSDGRTVIHVAAESGMREAVAYLCKKYKELYIVVDSTGRSPLYLACLQGYTRVIEQLIQSGMQPTVLTFNGESIVHACIRHGSFANLRFICERFDGLLATVDKDGNSVLHFAAMMGSTECLDYLLSKGLDPQVKGPKGNNILQSATSKGKLETMKYICERFPEMINFVDDKKRNALYYAATFASVDCMKYLISVDCDVKIFKKLGIMLVYGLLKVEKIENAMYICDTVDELLQATDADGNNPLHYAAITGSLPFLTYLLESKHADPYIRNYLGKTMLHVGAYYGHVETVKYICRNYRNIMKMEDSKQWSAVHDAASGGSLDCLIYLIRKGVSAGVRTSDKRTMLHIGAHYGRIDVVRWICTHYRAMMTELGDAYWTVLHDAASGSSLTCMRHLIKQGIDPMVRTADGKTILHVAVCFGKVDVVDYLCSKYKDLVGECDFSGNTALHYAAMGGNIDNFIALLLENIDKHAVNLDGSTALHTAAKAGSSEIVAYICRNHLEFMRVRDRYAWTALHSAAAGGSIACVEILVKNGMNPEAVTRDGATILTLSEEHPDLNNWLKSKLVKQTNCERCVIQ